MTGRPGADTSRGRIAARSPGYLPAAAGTLLGGGAGLAAGLVAGIPVARHVATGVASEGEPEGDGVEAMLEGFGVGLGAVVLGILAFVVVVLTTIWLGTVAGCWLALRTSGSEGAGRTALLAAFLGPPITLGVLWLAQVLPGDLRGTGAALVYGVAAVLTGLAARRATLGRQQPQTEE